MQGRLNKVFEKQGGVPWAIAIGLHLILFLSAWMFSKNIEPFKDINLVTVDLVTLPPTIADVPIIEKLPPKPQVRNDRPSIIKPQLKPPVKFASPDTNKDEASILAQETRPRDKEVIYPSKPKGSSSRWTLLPSAPKESLRTWPEGEGLALDIDCLRSLTEACRPVRKEVFAEQQLTDTEKVWTPKFAHTGLPVEFYGLSEREIRRRLNIPIAGENGIVIIPGLLALDGALWDAMYGVNRRCEWKAASASLPDAFARVGETTGSGRPGYVKVCPELKKAAKDTKNFLSLQRSLDKRKDDK